MSMPGKDGRNAKIVELANRGMKNEDIARRFGISTPRVSQIYFKEMHKARLKHDPMYAAFERAAERLGRPQVTAHRAYNALKKQGIGLDDLKDMGEFEPLRIRNIGLAALEIIHEARKEVE